MRLLIISVFAVMSSIATADRVQDKVPSRAILFRAPDGWMANGLMPGQYVDGDWRDGSRLQIHDSNTRGITLANLVGDDMKNTPMADLQQRELRWDGLSVVELEFSNFGYNYLERYIPGPGHRITTVLCHQPGPPENTTQRWQQSGRANCYALFSMISFDQVHYRWGHFDLNMIKAGRFSAKPFASK